MAGLYNQFIRKDIDNIKEGTMNILIAGDGHGAYAVYNGLSNTKYKIDFCTTDQVLIKLSEKNGSKVIDNIIEWDHLSNGLVILAGYRPIIKESIISMAKIINIHYSLLPKYRGFHSTVWAMLNGEEELGYTIHIVDSLVDNGDIIWQYKVKIMNKTSNEIMEEINTLVTNQIGGVVERYLNDDIKLTKQDYAQATFVGRRNKNDCRIEFTNSSKLIERMFKALVEPYPLPFFVYKEKEYEVITAEIIHKNYIEIPGHVVYIDNESVWIKLSDGLLRIYELRVDGQIIDANKIILKPGYRF